MNIRSNNLRQMALAMNTYHDAMKSLPPGNIVFDNLREEACHVGRMVYCGSIGWPVFILPYLEQTQLYDRVDFDVTAFTPEPGDSTFHPPTAPHGHENNRFVGENVPSVFICPSAVQQSKYHKDYGVNGWEHFPESFDAGTNRLFHWNSAVRFSDVKDGLSNTFLMLEACHHRRYKMSQNDTSPTETLTGCNPFFWVSEQGMGYATVRFMTPDAMYLLPPDTYFVSGPQRGTGSDHPAAFHASFCDGSVHAVSKKIDFDVYEGLFTKSGGEDVKLP